MGRSLTGFSFEGSLWFNIGWISVLGWMMRSKCVGFVGFAKLFGASDSSFKWFSIGPLVVWWFYVFSLKFVVVFSGG